MKINHIIISFNYFELDLRDLEKKENKIIR